MKCKDYVVTSALPWGCYGTLNVSQVDNGSFGYDSLKLDKDYLFVGKHIVTLQLYKNGEIKESCESEVSVRQTLATECGNSPLYITLEGNKPKKLYYWQFESYPFDHCFEVSYEVIPNTIDCNSPNPSVVEIKMIYPDGNWLINSRDVYYTLESSEDCMHAPEFQDAIVNKGNSIVNDSNAQSQMVNASEIVEKILIRHNGEVENIKYKNMDNIEPGLYCIKTVFKSGQILFKKIVVMH